MKGPLRVYLERRIPGKRPGTPEEVARLVGIAVRRGHRLPHRRDDLHRRRPGHGALMNVFERLRRTLGWSRRSSAIAGARAPRSRDEHDRAARRRATTRAASFPGTSVKAINALGLNAMFMPEAYGGAPLSLRRLSRLRARDQQGLRLHRHHLGDQLPRHEAADRLRQRGAEAAAAAAHRAGRPGVARHHRAERGLRRHRHEDALHARGRPHRRRRRQDLHHQRRRRRPATGVRQVERDRRRQGAISALVAGEGHAGLLGRCAPRTRWGCAPRARRRSPSTAAACRAPTCSGARRRPEDPARLAQQVAPEHRRARAGHRASPRSRT